jgi:hypothetical protein
MVCALEITIHNIAEARALIKHRIGLVEVQAIERRLERDQRRAVLDHAGLDLDRTSWRPFRRYQLNFDLDMLLHHRRRRLLGRIAGPLRAVSATLQSCHTVRIDRLRVAVRNSRALAR